MTTPQFDWARGYPEGSSPRELVLDRDRIAGELEATRRELSDYRGVLHIARERAGLPPKEREPSLILWIREQRANVEGLTKLRDELQARVVALHDAHSDEIRRRFEAEGQLASERQVSRLLQEELALAEARIALLVKDIAALAPGGAR